LDKSLQAVADVTMATSKSTFVDDFDDDDIDLSLIDIAEAEYYKKKVRIKNSLILTIVQEEENKKKEVTPPAPQIVPKLNISGGIMTSVAETKATTTLGSPPKSPASRMKKYHRLLVLEINNPTNFEKAKVTSCYYNHINLFIDFTLF
jgi:hypothetical protein